MDKNINVTLLTNQEDDESRSIKISFSSIFYYLKKFFLWWIIVSIILGFAGFGVLLLKQKSAYVGDIDALIAFNYNGIEKGLAPDGSEFDITKIKSPSIIEKSLASMQIDSQSLDKIRQSIEIKSVMSQDSVDKMTLYYKAYEKNQSLEAVESFLESENYSNQYIISFDYFNCDLSFGEGIEILNSILSTYSSYFFETYNYNDIFGSAVSIVDYTKYDYAEATNIFSNTLTDIENYIYAIKDNDDNNFRSSNTGYTFDDLSRTARTLREIDLDRVASYITINSVTNNNVDDMIAHYEYLVENIKRNKSVEIATLNALNESIAKYEKDPILLLSGSENNSNDSDVNKAYDDMIMRKIELQKKISGYNINIKYYNNIINSFKNSKVVKDNDIKEVENLLSILNNNVCALVENVNKTAEEYYSKVSFANSFKILVPASGSEHEVTISSSFMPLILVEVLLFLIYFMSTVIAGIVSYNKSISNEQNNNNLEQ